jgi:hypothetical protein
VPLAPNSPRASSASVVVRAATVLGLVWLGDALIYVVMPLHAPAFVLFFANAAIDGAFAFTLSLLFAASLPLGSAVLAAGLVLAFQRLMVVLLSLAGGALIDRVGAYRVLVPSVVLVVAGLFALAHGVLYPAAVVIVIVRSVLGVTGPVLAARERSGSTVERLAAFATWVDSGLAIGPLMSGFVVARFGLPALYQVLAVAIAGALVVHLTARARAA